MPRAIRPSTAHIPPFGLRLQPELKSRLEQAAAKAGRSMNAEITSRLEASFNGADASRVAELEQQVDGLMKQLLDARAMRGMVSALLDTTLSELPEQMRRSRFFAAMVQVVDALEGRTPLNNFAPAFHEVMQFANPRIAGEMSAALERKEAKLGQTRSNLDQETE